MRINRFIASATGLSRRAVDELIAKKDAVTVNGQPAQVGQDIVQGDEVVLDGKPVNLTAKMVVLLNKPVGYVVSRDGQGAPTIYELLPKDMSVYKPVGRLDKNSSGLLILTNDGQLAQELTHPSFIKDKVYEVSLSSELTSSDQMQLLTGVKLEDGPSKFVSLKLLDSTTYEVVLTEGRNRQIRRTFDALGYKVKKLHRTKFGNYALKGLQPGKFDQIKI